MALDPVFGKLGLADTAIVKLAPENYLVLTEKYFSTIQSGWC